MNKRGQSIIEYALIAVLVILGIVVMGPYVLRSVGAHFKLWDEGVQDSFTENLTQAPVNNVPFINATCNCSYQPGGCGSSQSGATCAANQRIYNLVCSIGSVQGCSSEPATTCQPDNSCCSCPVAAGCGNFPLPSNGILPGTACPANFQQCGINGSCVTLPASNNCYYGYQIYGYQCGPNNSIQCVQDPACPPPTCLGILSPGALYCVNNSTIAPTNLLQNNGITYVGNGPSSCPANPTCQLYCASPYALNATKTACEILSCSYTFQVASSNCGSCATIPGGGCDCSFTVCAAQGTILSNLTVTDVSSPQNSPYCGNPGNPGEECQISFTY